MVTCAEKSSLMLRNDSWINLIKIISSSPEIATLSECFVRSDQTSVRLLLDVININTKSSFAKGYYLKQNTLSHEIAIKFNFKQPNIF